MPCGPCGPTIVEIFGDLPVPVPVADVDVTFVGVTTITFEDNVLLDVAVLELFALTGPFTPVVFVVFAFVVVVDPLTTEMGPFAPELPTVSTARAWAGKTTASAKASTYAICTLANRLMASGSLKP